MKEEGPSAGAKLDLKNVAVILEQKKVYRNGLQQARLRLDLESEHDGTPSDLTPTEIASIGLIDYHDMVSGAIPFSDDGSLTYQGWSAQLTYRGYVAHPNPPAMPDAPDAPRQSYFIYVSASSAATETLDFSFVIKGDDGSIWRTNGRVFRNGVEQLVPAMDLKVGITMTPVSPERYPASAFSLDRHPFDQSLPSHSEDAAAIFDDVVTLSIHLVDGTTLDVRDMTCAPAGMIHWQNKLPGTTNPCFTGYVKPGETGIHWHPEMYDHFGAQPRPLNIPSPETAVGVIVLCGRIDIPTWVGAPEDSMTATLTDAHGSLQTCHIGFVAGKRDELIVT